MVEVNSLRNTDSEVGVKRSVHSVIEQRSMKVVFQPIVDHVQNRVLGHEALIRPMLDGQAIRPDYWFLAAYELNRSVEADLLALASVFEDFTTLPDLSRSAFLFVNVMPSSLRESAFSKELESMFNLGVCRPEQLVFEIIEYIDYDPRLLSAVVNSLRSFGARIALDDFGVEGVHSDAISELEPDFVKIDRSLIQGIAESTFKQNVLSDLVQQMSFSHSVIAEGIENTEDLLVVQEAGIALSQGYYWGRPAPSNDLQHLIRQIESERNTLEDIVEHKQGVLTDPQVLCKSREIDRLIIH